MSSHHYRPDMTAQIGDDTNLPANTSSHRSTKSTHPQGETKDNNDATQTFDSRLFPQEVQSNGHFGMSGYDPTTGTWRLSSRGRSSSSGSKRSVLFIRGLCKEMMNDFVREFCDSGVDVEQVGDGVTQVCTQDIQSAAARLQGCTKVYYHGELRPLKETGGRYKLHNCGDWCGRGSEKEHLTISLEDLPFLMLPTDESREFVVMPPLSD